MKFGIIFDKMTERFRKVSYGYNVREGNYRPLEMDPINWGLHVIDSEHHEIHEGTSYSAYYTRTTASTDNHRSGIYIKTPAKSINTLRAHVVVSFASSAAAKYEICEGVTIDANAGTHTGDIINRFRDSTRVSGCLSNATVPVAGKFTTLDETQIAAASFASGTVIRTAPLQVGVGPRTAGGGSRGAQEYILKADTAYVFLLTNVGANANVHHILLDWYEHKTYDH